MNRHQYLDLMIKKLNQLDLLLVKNNIDPETVTLSLHSTDLWALVNHWKTSWIRYTYNLEDSHTQRSGSLKATSKYLTLIIK